jgi:hypothetical protein
MLNTIIAWAARKDEVVARLKAVSRNFALAIWPRRRCEKVMPGGNRGHHGPLSREHGLAGGRPAWLSNPEQSRLVLLEVDRHTVGQCDGLTGPQILRGLQTAKAKTCQI